MYPSGYPDCGRAVNEYTRCLSQAMAAHAYAVRVTETMGDPGVNAPWLSMPPQAKRYQEVGNIVLPAQGASATVRRWRVPIGYDGVLLGVTARFTGAGFAEGGGDLTFRFQQDFHYFRNLEAVQWSLGDLASPYDLEGAGYRIRSNQVLTMSVARANPSAGLNPAGRIIMAMSGYLYPLGGDTRRFG